MREKRLIEIAEAGYRTLVSSLEETSTYHFATDRSVISARRAALKQRKGGDFWSKKLKRFPTYRWHWWVIFTNLEGNFDDERPETIAALLVVKDSM